MKQSIGLTSVANARELGGYRIGDSIVKKSVLLRSGSLVDITEEDKKILSEKYHLSMLVDFRMRMETESFPDPEIGDAIYLKLPVMEMEDSPEYDEELAKEAFKKGRLEMLKDAIRMGMLDERLYAYFLLSDRGKEAYRNFFKVLLELPEGGGVLWHCTDGKDRTGIAAMLLLTALGADKELIIEDYLLSNEYNSAKIQLAEESVRGMDVTEEVKRQITFGLAAVYESYMASAMQALTDKYGSVDGYLATEIGVGESEKDILRTKFLSA